MAGTALVLAAHGSHREPAVNARVRALAEALAARSAFAETGVAFHQGEPTFAAVLDTLTAEDVVVVPVMASAGHYCDTVLPRELAGNGRYPGIRLRITPPVGVHPRMASLVAARIEALLRAHRLDAAATTAVLVAHGTERHPGSRASAEAIVADLKRRGRCAETLAAFLDDAPGVEAVPDLATRPNLVVIPFLIGAGPHATSDTPRRLGLDVAADDAPPFTGRAGGRFVVCDAPIGSDPGLVDVIADLAAGDATSPVDGGTDLPEEDVP